MDTEDLHGSKRRPKGRSMVKTIHLAGGIKFQYVFVAVKPRHLQQTPIPKEKTDVGNATRVLHRKED